MTLPAINSAKLPESYERAKKALSECSKIDECQDWADKAEALASYAKQSKDDSLRKMADRIQARAIRRAGELYKQIPDGKGRNQYSKGGEGALPTRIQAATDAGMSEHQRKQALRVANVSEEQFNGQVESDNPPTVTALAEQGKKSLVDLEGIDSSLYAEATQVGGQLRRMAAICKKTDPRKIAEGFHSHEIESLRESVHAIDGWLDLFVTNLGD